MQGIQFVRNESNAHTAEAVRLEYHFPEVSLEFFFFGDAHTPTHTARARALLRLTARPASSGRALRRCSGSHLPPGRGRRAVLAEVLEVEGLPQLLLDVVLRC